jgi:hypothetical protein
MKTLIDNRSSEALLKTPEKKTYNSGLRALLTIRNFSDVLEKHYARLIQIEEDINELNNKTYSIIENSCSPDSCLQWKAALKEFNDSVLSVNEVINSFREKITIRDRSDTSTLWTAFDGQLDKLKKSYKALELMGSEILPENEQIIWENDTRKYESIFISSLISYTESCRVELRMIEKYTPEELNKINQLILEHIPKDFTLAEADEYEKDYLDALVEFKQEFQKEKNLWDTFLDILAGGAHQTPEEHVMMKRWLDGEKGDLA